MNVKVKMPYTTVVGLLIWTAAAFFGPAAAQAQKITIDEVIHLLLLGESQIQSIQVDVIQNQGTAEELRGVLKWRSGGNAQLTFTEDGNGDPLANPIVQVINETSILEVAVDGQRTYHANQFDYLNSDVISALNGVAIDTQLMWVFDNNKTIIDETVDNLYTIKTIGKANELRLLVDIDLKVVRQLDHYILGTLRSTFTADDFALVGAAYFPFSGIVDVDVTDGQPPVTFNYSNYAVNPVLPDRIFKMPQ